MTQPFLLQLSDGSETISFISQTYRVTDGGFDIGLPQAERRIDMLYPGVFSSVNAAHSYRTAHLRFNVYGTSRSAILTSLHKIERLLWKFGNKSIAFNGTQGQLAYAWDGADNITYFEVLGGDLQFPSDLLSVAKIHATRGDDFILPEVELSLFLSPYGYGISIYGEPTEVPLVNGTVAEKTTGGVEVKNPIKYSAESQDNWVEIDGDDLPGSQPVFTKLVFTPTTVPYAVTWQSMYVGVKRYPFGLPVLLDMSTVVVREPNGSLGYVASTSDSNAEANIRKDFSFSTPYIMDTYPLLSWVPSIIEGGAYYTFLQSRNPVNSDWTFSVGLLNGVNNVYKGDYVPGPGLSTVPVGPISLFSTYNKGDGWSGVTVFDPSFYLSIYMTYVNSAGSAGNLSVDGVYLLPIDDGLRVLKQHKQLYLLGDYVDDGWHNQQYYAVYTSETARKVYSSFYALQDPLRLMPNETQRLYFMSCGVLQEFGEKNRTFNVKLYAVPTYLTLAM